MSIKRRKYELSDQNQIQALKNIFGIWSFGIIIIILGLYFFPESKVLGISLVALALIVVPFIINTFLKR